MNADVAIQERRIDVESVVRRTTSGATLAGAVVAIAAMVVLGNLGIAVRVTTAETLEPSARGLDIAATVWTVVAGLLSLLAGGYAAGRLSALRRRSDGLFHGLVVWAIVVVASALLARSILVRTAFGGFGLETVTRDGATLEELAVGAWWTVTYLILGAVTAALGGWLGTRARRSPRGGTPLDRAASPDT
jgi:hypothetical protein